MLSGAARGMEAGLGSPEFGYLGYLISVTSVTSVISVTSVTSVTSVISVISNYGIPLSDARPKRVRIPNFQLSRMWWGTSLTNKWQS